MKKAIARIFASLTSVTYCLLFIFFVRVSFYRYNIFQVFYYDFGIFARIIWQLSRFQLPYINHLSLGRIFFLGDHFNPSLVILAPLFWLTSNLKVILVEQALVTVLSGILVFLIAKKLKLTRLSSFLISLSFLFFAGVENPLVTDWHTESTAGFFLLLFFYLFNFTHLGVLSFISAIIFLGFKESNTLTLIFLLFFLYFLNSKKRKQIIGLTIFSLVWFLATTKIIIPAIAKQPYFYTPDIPRSIIGIVSNFFNPSIKRQLVFNSLVSFGFLPIFSLVGLIPILGELAIRFIPSVSKFQSYTLAMHYNVYLGIFLALATVYGIIKIKKIFKGNKIIELALVVYLFLASLVVARKITFSPINLAINRVFWQEIQGNEKMLKIIENVPKKGSVMSQNNILPHLVNREEELYFLNSDYEKYKPDIIIIDLTPDQNINNVWGSDLEVVKRVKEELLQDSRYIYKNPGRDYLYIFYRK